MYARWLYTLCFTLLLPAILLRLLWRSRKAPAYRRRWGERFGHFPAPRWQSPQQRPLWIHAVSVGETLAAIPLIRALQQQDADRPLLITTTTPTGSERVQALFADAIAAGRLFHVYAPYDLPWTVENFLQRTKPRMLIIMETELWPNLMHGCIRHHVPVVLANARLSEKSARGYQRLAPLTQNMLKKLYRVAAQNESDAQRFIRIGYDPNRLAITGSIKFDLELTPEVLALASQLRKDWSGEDSRETPRAVWLAASTHPGEDEMVLHAFAALKRQYPRLLLVLVPRHPERFNNVLTLCQQQGFSVQRRSAGESCRSDTDIVLGDTMGELLAFYGACDIAFVGGSLVPVGGHNLIEAAAWGKPIISGPHLHNFAEISRLLTEKDALLISRNAAQLQEQLQHLLSDPAEIVRYGLQAQRVALQNRGALARLLTVIEDASERWKTRYPSQPWE